MSDLSNRTGPFVTETLDAAPGAAVPAPRPTGAIRIWAVIGGALLVLQLYVWARWITGPYFTSVPQGPSEPAGLAKAMLTLNWAFLWVGLPVALWWWLIRPWRRERRITLDGMLMVSMGLMVFQDPLLNYVNTWCVYNTSLFNRGSWSSEIPGWVSAESPGRQTAEPLLTNLPGYFYGVLLVTVGVCWLMRRIRDRWPNISTLRLIAVTYAISFVLDFVMEGLLLLPMGFYSYPGAIRAVSINPGTYYQWPVYEGLMWGGVQAALCCLRFFTDDRGRTVVERGLDQIRGGAVRQQAVRFLALFGAVSACFFVFYNVPAQWVGTHADPWPTDVQKRSYLAGGVCGEGVGLCPDPSLPIITKRSGTITPDGKFVLPEGKPLPKTVPFERG